MNVKKNTFPPEIWNRIMKSLNLVELHKLSLVSKPFYFSVGAHLSVRFRALINEYVEGVTAFSWSMMRTDVVISGSRALQFVMPASSPPWTIEPADLDLYAPLDKEDQVLEQLLDDEGYRLCRWIDHLSIPPFPGEYPYSANRSTQGIKRIITVYHPLTEKTIDIIVSNSPSPLTAIFAFHSTPVMNWITPRSVTVAYPEWTFAQRGIISAINFAGGAQTLPERVESALKKYRVGRHFEFQYDPSMWMGPHACGTVYGCTQTIRHSDDHGIAIIVFGRDGRVCEPHRMGPSRNKVGAGAIWRLGGPICKLGSNHDRQYGKGMEPFSEAVPKLTSRWF